MKRVPRSSKSIRKQKLNFKPKAPKFPEGMILVQDTREQIPLFDRMPKGLMMVSATLKDGDYSIRGHESTFCIERKRIGDLITYCTSERTKTIAKMKRFQKMDWVGLVIEARESDILRPYEWSSVSPEAVRQALVSFSIRYGVHVYISANKESIVRWVVDRAIKYYRVKSEV